MKLNIFMLLLITGAFFSCKKYNDNIVIAGQQGVSFGAFINDTLAVEGTTIKEDSILGNNLSYYLLGNCNDPYLGDYSNNLVCKLTLNEPTENFPTGVTADSAILFIPFIQGLNFYGNQLSNQHISVNEIDETISASNFYYQGWNYKTSSTIGSYFGTLYFTQFNNIKNNNLDLLLPPGLYIKLDQTFANKLTNLSADAYKSNENLEKELKGIALEALSTDKNAGQGGYGVFDLSGDNGIASLAKVMVYYNDTSTFIFSLANAKTCVNVGKSYGYSADVQNQLQTATKSTIVYAQGGNSVKSKITLKNLNTLSPNKKVVVNYATLTVHIADNTTDYFFTAPKRLNLLLPQKGTIKSTIIKDQVDPTGSTLQSIGGAINPDGKSYTFIVTRQLQEWINNYVDNKTVSPDFTVSIPSDNPITGSRAILDLSKTKIKITYTIAN